MHRYFYKRYWKNSFRKKKESLVHFFLEFRGNFPLGRSTNSSFGRSHEEMRHIKAQRLNFSLKCLLRRFWFTLKSPKKPWWVIVGGLTLILILLGLPAYFLGYPLLREYKFRRFEKTAKAALENGDNYTALLTAQTAHLLQPENLSALKTLVKAAQLSNHPKLFSLGTNFSQS